MEISYKLTWRDRQEGYRVGLSHLLLPYRLVGIGGLLLMPVGMMLILYGKGYPFTWTAANLPLRLMLLNTFLPLGFLLGFFLTTAIGSGFLFRSQVVQLLPLHLAWKKARSSNLIRWKRITEIVDTGEYICFCQNYPTAVAVPKRAFPNQGQSAAFLEQATRYWREAKGLPEPSVPDTAGVWPPAPRPGDSA